jgi:hypothetical protein
MVVLNAEWTRKIAGVLQDLGLIGTQGGIYQWRVVEAIHHGTYNDYGWLNEVDENLTETEHPKPAIFFHKAVWDWVISLPVDEHHRRFQDMLENEQQQTIERFKRIMKEPDADVYSDGTFVKITPELKQFQHLCAVAGNLRRDIFSGLRFRGSQENDLPDEVRAAFLALENFIFEGHKKMFAEFDS